MRLSQRVSPSGQSLKPPLKLTKAAGPPAPTDPVTEEARKQAAQRAELAARVTSKQAAAKPKKENRQSKVGDKRGGYKPPTEEGRRLGGFKAVPEEQRFSPRREIENKMSPPNPQLISPTGASLGKSVIDSNSSGPSRPKRGGAEAKQQVGSRDTIFATKSALGHTHVEAAEEPTELERLNMPKRTARRVEQQKQEKQEAKPWHYWVQQEMAGENKKNAGGSSGGGGGSGASARWAQHSEGVGSKGQRPDPASMSKSTVVTPDHPQASTFTPELAPQTRRIMAGRRDSLAAERSGFQHTNYGELLYRDGTEKRADKMKSQESEAQRMVAEKEQMEMEDCTFTPVRVTAQKNGKYRNYANSVSIVDRTNAVAARTAAQQKTEQAAAERQSAEMEGCTFTPKIKKHRTHRARPAVETRLLQLHDRHAARAEWISEVQAERAQHKKAAVPTINKQRAMSPEQRKVQDEQIEKTGGAQPVHNRLHTSYQRHLPSPPPGGGLPRPGSPTGAHDGSHASFAGYRDAKPASPTRRMAYERMEKVRKRRLFAPFYTQRDHFTKTGSGQTQEKLRKERRFLIGHCRAPGARGGAPLCDRERSTRPRNDAPHPQELRVAAVGEGGARAPRPVSRRGCGGQGLLNEAPVRGGAAWSQRAARERAQAGVVLQA
jgi:hypothetical protein